MVVLSLLPACVVVGAWYAARSLIRQISSGQIWRWRPVLGNQKETKTMAQG